MASSPEPMPKHTYKQAGVDIHEAAAFVDDISTLVKATQKKRKLANAFGLFAAGYDLSKYQEPVIFTGCDGVGTKLELLLKHNLLENAGKDLVAMNVNDVLTTGADPILFLDYVGVNRINKRQLTRIIAGMSEYLQSCDCILAGGETAEMPGAVLEGMVELSGFAIGAAEKKHVLNPAEIKEDDVLIGWPSAGFHANGFSLVRHIIAREDIKLSKKEAAQLLAPTLLYHEQCRGLRRARIKPAAMAHITGGGLPENLGRIFTRRGLGCHLRVPFWQNDVVQKILRHADPADAWDTFNMGIGWVAIVDPKQAAKALKIGTGAVVLGTMDRSGRVTCEVAGA